MQPLVDSKKVTINIVTNAVHLSRLSTGADMDNAYGKIKIGSAYTSSGAILRGLSAEEEKLFLPRVIGITPNDNMWEQACADYWANLSVPVPAPGIDGRGGGLPLEVGFEYASETDAAKGRDEASKQEAAYLKWEDSLKTTGYAGLARRFKEDFFFRQKHGTPINLTDYILYRYCLNYSAVALNVKYIGNSAKIRFYINDTATEQKAEHAKLTLKRDAMIAYSTLLGDRKRVKAIINVLHLEIMALRDMHNRPYPIDSEQSEDILLGAIVETYPARFLNVTKDNKLMGKSFVEGCIQREIARRLPNTDTIYFGDNLLLGNTIEEAVDFLANPQNAETLRQMQAQLQIATEPIV